MATRQPDDSYARVPRRPGWRQPMWPALATCLVLAAVFGSMLVHRRHPQPLALRCLAATAEPVAAADGRLVVTSLDEAGPAARAGVRVGDILPPGLAVPAAPGSDLPMRFTVARDAGQAGIAVVLPDACRNR